MKNKYIYVGAASDLGVHIDGSSLGPSKILSDKENKLILKQNPDFQKSHDPNDLRKNFNELYNYTNELYNIINEQYNYDQSVLMIGGDHSNAVPSALASVNKHGNIGLIWFDAHTDYHTLASTTSGNLHGLPCALINGYGDRSLTAFHDGDYIDPSKTVIIGARSIDDGEYINCDATKVRVITIEEVKSRGMKECLEEAFSIALKDTNGVHISYDLDGLDPSLAPAVSTPVENGVNREEFEITNNIFRQHHDDIVSFDLVEFNPLRDVNDLTLKTANQVIDAILNK